MTLLEKIRSVRTSTTLSLKECPLVSPSFKLLPYQAPMVVNMLMVSSMVNGDDTGSGKCACRWQQVSTKEGIFPIGSFLKEGQQEDEFASLDGVLIKNQYGYEEATKSYNGGVKPCLRVTLDKGQSFSGTLPHRLIVHTPLGFVWRKLSELLVGDLVVLDAKAPSLESVVFSKEAWLVGLLIGDGSYNSTWKYPSFWGLHALWEKIIDMFPEFQIEKPEVSLGSVIGHRSSRHFNYVLQKFGAVPATPFTKRIPLGIMQSPLSIRYSCVCGMLDTDGCINPENGGVTYGSVSKDLCLDLQMVLSSLGIPSDLRPKRGTYNGKLHLSWRLSLSTYHLKVAGIPFSYFKPWPWSRDLEISPSVGERSVRWSVPKDAVFCEIMTKWRSRFKLKVGSGDRLKSLFCVLRHLDGRGFNQSSLHWMLNQPQASYLTTDERSCLQGYLNIALSTVTSIEDIGCQPVVDLSLPKTSSYSANGIISHNTLESVIFYAARRQQDSSLNCLIVSPKNAVFQWQEEFQKVCPSIPVTVIRSQRPAKSGFKRDPDWRKSVYEAFPGGVLVCNYAHLYREVEEITKALGKFVVIYDEATRFKGEDTTLNKRIRMVSQAAVARYALTATVIKGNLFEAYGICVGLGVYPWGSLLRFKNLFAEWKQQKIKVRGRQRTVSVVCGWKNLSQFRSEFEPFFWGRPIEELAPYLPEILTKTMKLEMPQALRDKYSEAEEGLFQMANGEIKETVVLSRLLYCQLVSDSAREMGFDLPDSKVDALWELLEEDLAGEQVIIYTRFKRMVRYLEKWLKGKGVKVLTVTGDESDEQRFAASKSFRSDPTQRVVLLNNAGNEAMNLQTARAVIFFDLPWCWGDYKQTVGRARRQGGVQKNVLVLHLCHEGTIDEDVLSLLLREKELVVGALGSANKMLIEDGDFVTSLYNRLSERRLERNLLRKAENNEPSGA